MLSIILSGAVLKDKFRDSSYCPLCFSLLFMTFSMPLSTLLQLTPWWRFPFSVFLRERCYHSELLQRVYKPLLFLREAWPAGGLVDKVGMGLTLMSDVWHMDQCKAWPAWVCSIEVNAIANLPRSEAWNARTSTILLNRKCLWQHIGGFNINHRLAFTHFY